VCQIAPSSLTCHTSCSPRTPSAPPRRLPPCTRTRQGGFPLRPQATLSRRLLWASSRVPALRPQAVFVTGSTFPLRFKVLPPLTPEFPFPEPRPLVPLRVGMPPAPSSEAPSPHPASGAVVHPPLRAPSRRCSPDDARCAARAQPPSSEPSPLTPPRLRFHSARRQPLARAPMACTLTEKNDSCRPCPHSDLTTFGLPQPRAPSRGHARPRQSKKPEFGLSCPLLPTPASYTQEILCVRSSQAPPT